MSQNKNVSCNKISPVVEFILEKYPAKLCRHYICNSYFAKRPVSFISKPVCLNYHASIRPLILTVILVTNWTLSMTKVQWAPDIKKIYPWLFGSFGIHANEPMESYLSVICRCHHHWCHHCQWQHWHHCHHWCCRLCTAVTVTALLTEASYLADTCTYIPNICT